jgi:uncharacterized protein (TIGR04168 family)
MNNATLDTINIAAIGDIHDQWDAEDAAALKALGVDAVLFVGDFGNESVAVVRQIADVDLPKAAIFGNHDAWYSATARGRKHCPYQRPQEDWLRDQMELLDRVHVGYRALAFPELGFSVAGGRPFSWGGSVWKYWDFYHQWFGVSSFEESADRITAAALEAPSDTLIFLGHTGPTGLGDLPEDPCGRDWQPLGGDFGDPDFREAIDRVRASGKHIPLVVFGHMHHHLRHRSDRLRRCVHVEDGTVYYNAASVPRILNTDMGKQRNFSLISLRNGIVEHIALVWVDSDYQIATQKTLYNSDPFTLMDFQ